MESRDYAVYKHIIVPHRKEISIGSTDFGVSEDCLDDPHRGSDHRVRLNFNEVALLENHLTTSK